MASTPTPPIAGESIAAATVSTSGSHINTTMGNYNIDKLDGMSNYNKWKFCMKMALTLENLWHCIQGNEVVDYQDQRPLAKICLAVQPHCYQYVQNAITSKEAWSNLASKFLKTQACIAEFCCYVNYTGLRWPHTYRSLNMWNLLWRSCNNWLILENTLKTVKSQSCYSAGYLQITIILFVQPRDHLFDRKSIEWTSAYQTIAGRI